MNYRIYLLLIILNLISCSEKPSEKNNKLTDGALTLFTKVSAKSSGITFMNNTEQTNDFNFMNYMYIYTGAGLATGDIDHDGLEDVYLVSNSGPNKLYKNRGNFEFEDITRISKTEDEGGFSTGVCMLDINNDGWLDIYVCKAGSLNDDEGRRNLLFINQQNGSFVEEAAKWGLNDPGYSTQIYSIDYDKDGDLDLYLVNHRYDFKNNGKISSEIQSQIEETTSDQLYRNDNRIFTKVTGEAGLYNKAWGLSAIISDFNDDGWDDIYVANDFLEPDAMYINQKDGTFKNEINNRLNHISTNSMGSDNADLNNDLHPDILTLDMASESHVRSKENMAPMSTSNFMKMVKVGYHHAYMANMLQYNQGNGKFKETAQMGGVSKTDWSWAPLIADFDNDGLKDIFISNGVERDYTNQDARNILKGIMAEGSAMKLEDILSVFPSEKTNNYIFRNNGDLTFTKKIEEWGLNDPGFSNGAAYVDFDNDGDLDIITNNLHGEAGVYQNNASNNYLQIKLSGPLANPLAIGAKVYVSSSTETQFLELYLARGFESSVSSILNFGLGNEAVAQKVVVQWPDGKTSTLENIASNQKVTIDYTAATSDLITLRDKKRRKKHINPAALGIQYIHKENDFNDYSLQLLLPQKQSTKGTGIAKADVNGDGLEDFFVGNAKNAIAALYLQKSDGTFIKSNETLWAADAKYEDANALFFDADGDGDQDLYVVSSGYELAENDPLLQDRLYINNGTGKLTKNNSALPSMLISGKSVTSGDYDNDGDLDLFVGGNVVPQRYPLPPKSYLLKNDRGKFTDATADNKDLSSIGMVAEAVFTDYDNDKDLDLMVVGEWMAPTFFTNKNGHFEVSTAITGLKNTEGWWQTISMADLDGDGDQDYLLGNIGTNNKFHPTTDKPLYINANDFDANGSYDVAMSKISDGKIVPIRGKECSSQQNPFLLDKIKTFEEFAHLEMKDIYGEEKLKDAYKLTAHLFESVYVENLGNGDFKIKKLPNIGQTGPTLSFVTNDFNNDGFLDIMGVGAIYDAEVETIRYDSNYGYVLLGDGKGNFVHSKEYDPFIDSDSKDMTEINIKGKAHYVVVSNNAPLEIFTFLP
ncbi:MAG: hypothetical protein ACJAX3_002875 [Patiriisocius sp.]|jgi:hypothetical protein